MNQLNNMKKIFIIGVSGSGKSTLSKQLSKLLKIPHFDLDDIFFIKRYNNKRKSCDCEIKLKELLKKNKSWIIEGVYYWGKIAIDKADLVIWLNYKINVSIYRVIKRWFTRKREDRGTMKELYYLIQHIRTYKKIKPNKKYSAYEKHKKIISKNKHNLVKIKNNKDLRELLKKIQNF